MWCLRHFSILPSVLKPTDSVHFVQWSGSIWNYRTSGGKEPWRGAGSHTHTSTHSEQVRRLILLTGIQSSSLMVLPAAGGQRRQVFWVLQGTWPSRFLRQTAQFLKYWQWVWMCLKYTVSQTKHICQIPVATSVQSLHFAAKARRPREGKGGARATLRPDGRAGRPEVQVSWTTSRTLLLTPGCDPRTPQIHWFAGMETRRRHRA